jgi:CRP/FNR family cyclic AMP-dependent transcriptional regulator
MGEDPAPYHLKVIDSCFACVMREEGLFCQLSQGTLTELNALRQTSFYPRNAILFVEGEPPRGVFVLCAGQAKLTVTSMDGQSLTLRFVEPGEVLGLSSVIGNTPYAAAADILAPSQVSFIPRLPFLQFLRAHTGVSLRVAKHLSNELHTSWDQSRMLALAPSTQAKVAQFLVAWAAQHGTEIPEGIRLALNMTHDEIAKTIGASRESVSRVLGDFRLHRLIRVNRGTLVVLQPNKLRELAVEHQS